MFTVVDKETGETYCVYGNNGLFFLVYDAATDEWAYKDINRCRLCKPEEAQQQRIAELEAELKDERHRHDRYVDFELAEAEELRKLKAERDDLLMIIRFHTDCEFCKHEHVLACEEPCSSCRGTGGKEDKWEWLRPEEGE